MQLVLVTVGGDSSDSRGRALASRESTGALALCLTFRRAFAPLQLAACDAASERQRWEYDPLLKTRPIWPSYRGSKQLIGRGWPRSLGLLWA